MESSIYFHKNDITNLKNELHQLEQGDIILIHKNKITIVSDYDQKNNDYAKPFNKLNDDINNDVPYEDNIIFSYYSNETNNIYNTGFYSSEAIYITITLQNNIIYCDCEKIEVDPKSFMYDQLANGIITFEIKDNDIVYLDGECQDRAGDCYGISPNLIISILNILIKYWKY